MCIYDICSELYLGNCILLYSATTQILLYSRVKAGCSAALSGEKSKEPDRDWFCGCGGATYR